MIRINTLLRLAVAIGVAAFGFDTYAANLTVSIPACSSYSLTNNVLTCTTGNACSITGPSSALAGATVTLNGSCAASSTLTWGGCTSATGGTCTLNSGAAGAVTVTLNGSLGETPASQVVTFGGAASCSVLPGSANVAINTTGQTFSASCNFTPTTYAWTGCTSSTSTCTVPAQATPGTVNVSVAASDGASNNATGNGSVTFNINTTRGVPITCGDGTPTVAATTMSVFGDGAVNVVDPFAKGQTAVFPIIVPNLGASPTNVAFQFSSFGGFSDKVGRWAWVSKSPCNLASDTFQNKSVAYGSQSGTIAGVIDFSNLGVVGAGTATPVVHMTPGDTWYVMFQNQTPSLNHINSCTLSDCPIQLQATIQR